MIRALAPAESEAFQFSLLAILAILGNVVQQSQFSIGNFDNFGNQSRFSIVNFGNFGDFGNSRVRRKPSLS